MTATTYIYPGTAGDAAFHLLDNSALADCTTREDVFYAGADAIRVSKQPWRLSDGEELLWSAFDSLARGGGDVNLGGCVNWLDADNRRVLVEAVGMALGVGAVVA